MYYCNKLKVRDIIGSSDNFQLLNLIMVVNHQMVYFKNILVSIQKINLPFFTLVFFRQNVLINVFLTHKELMLGSVWFVCFEKT